MTLRRKAAQTAPGVACLPTTRATILARGDPRNEGHAVPAAGADQPPHTGHMPKPSPCDLDGKATDCADELAREEALRGSTLRVPR